MCKDAELRNVGFEAVDAKGKPSGWRSGGALLITDAKGAVSGERCAKCGHDGRFVQALEVKKDQPIRLRMKVRGEGTR